jgi:hypothetical protein
MTYVFLSMARMNCSFVIICIVSLVSSRILVPYIDVEFCGMENDLAVGGGGVKKPVKSPTSFPKTRNIKGIAIPAPIAQIEQMAIMV